MCKKNKSDFERMIRCILQKVEFILRSKEMNSIVRMGVPGEERVVKVHHDQETGRRTGTSVLFGGRDIWGNSRDTRRIE